MELEKIQRERAVDAVYQALRQAIVSSLMKPGERLNVDELARKLGVSLTPVRSAIQQLANEGLVEIRPRSGTFVASLSPQDVEETFEIRCALEQLAGEKAVANIKPAALKRLRGLLRSLARPTRSDEDRKAHEQDNSELHRIIVEAAGNRRLLEMYEALNAHIKIARIHSAEANWPARMEQEQAEHEEIVNALEKRDAAALARVLRRHIYRAKDALVATLRAR
ncbi:MAG TPA: GntR family transcriptional regulator [Bryobacteraceae bacterium]|jgi:DNA-binding GntR family transcriptional regulator|nr:GntR family transcriptional regulator [Bryobacteraceae bacterium]